MYGTKGALRVVAGRRGLVPALLAGVLSLLAGRLDAQLTLRVTGVPAGTPDVIHVAGTFNGWDPADTVARLVKREDGDYAVTLPAQVRGAVEFKFTLGSWDAVELDSAGAGVPNRTFIVPASGAATYTATVARWQDPANKPPVAHTASANVSILDSAFAMPQLGRTRRIWIYLPPDYATSDKRYPVLYMHDGQNVFDAATAYAGEWGVDESLDSLHAAGDPGVIVVGIDNGQALRMAEYSPWVHPRHGGGEGEAYADWLAKTLKPWIDRHYRTRPEPASTGIMGSSMGGLISLYAALRHPEVFGQAGVFSPSLWYSDSVFVAARAGVPGARPRMYFVSGGSEGPQDDPRTVVVDQARMMDTLVAAGWSVGTDLFAAAPDDGRHAEWFWRREFPAAYRWLFARPPAAPRR